VLPDRLIKAQVAFSGEKFIGAADELILLFQNDLKQ
jgi:hypothetical protein